MPPLHPVAAPERFRFTPTIGEGRSGLLWPEGVRHRPASRRIPLVKNELRILVLEDVAADVVLIDHELRNAGLAFNAKRVETRDEFVRELEQHPPDIILSDHGLPAFDGFSALSIARERCPDTPFIFVTGS